MVLLLAPAFAAPCERAVSLPPEDFGLAEELLAMGVELEAEACEPLEVQVEEQAEGLLVTVSSPEGEETRSLPTAFAAAAFVESWTLSSARLDELLHPKGAEPGTLVLYASFEDWRAGRSSGELQAELIEHGAEASGPPGTVDPFFQVDLRYLEARAYGPVWAFEREGRVYVNESAPAVSRMARYGLLEELGDQAVFQSRWCTWVQPTETVPGHVRCDDKLVKLDLESGELDTVHRFRMQRWLADEPELLEAWQAERPKDMGTHRLYLRRLYGE